MFRALFGYFRIFFRREQTEEIYNLLLTYHITGWGFSLESETEVSICITLGDFSYFLRCAKEKNINVLSYNKCGILKIFEKYRGRYGILCGLILFFSLLIVSSFFVWRVDVSGNAYLSEGSIKQYLSDAGLHVGTFIPKIQTTEICNEVMLASKEVAWMSIRREGTIVSVEIMERIPTNEEEKKIGYANLIASEDAVIEEISISKGMAKVKTGQTVKKGDLLISGVYESPRKYTLLYAEGTVLGRVTRNIVVKIPLQQLKKTYQKGKTIDFSVIFFGFPINIFRYTGKMPTKYDTIDKEYPLLLLNGTELPIRIAKQECLIYTETEFRLSEEEAVALAFVRLRSELAMLLSDMQLVSKQIRGYFSDSEYILECEAICLRDITVPLPFEAE